jgi:hypothetical protein
VGRWWHCTRSESSEMDSNRHKKALPRERLFSEPNEDLSQEHHQTRGVPRPECGGDQEGQNQE